VGANISCRMTKAAQRATAGACGTICGVKPQKKSRSKRTRWLARKNRVFNWENWGVENNGPAQMIDQNLPKRKI